MITDIYSCKIVGWKVHTKKSDNLSSSLVKRACLSEGVSGKDKEILKNRKRVYKEARRRHPERWTRKIRNCDFIGKVDLNPDKKKGSIN